MEVQGKGFGFAAALVCALVLVLALAAASHAQTPPASVYGDAKNTGTIHLIVYGPPGSQATVFEEYQGNLRPIRTVALNPVGPFWDIAQWRCDRRERRFVVAIPLPDGSVSTAVYETRTPSCRKRMALRVPGTVRPGQALLARISDRWRVGGVSPSLCVAPPNSGFRCETVGLRRGRAVALRRLRLSSKGAWRVELRLGQYRTRRQVHVGGGQSFVLRGAPSRVRTLLTGDSMMLNIDSVVADRLRASMETVSDTKVGSGLSKPGFNWIAHARRQMRRLQPDATVVFVGANDAFEMKTPAGARVACCGEPWIAEYSRRVGAMMSIYGREGQASSVWLTIPAPRSPELLFPIAAVNEGIRRAASVTPGVRVLKLDELFSPGFRYRAQMPVQGQQRRVRADDGLHLSLVGARMAASLVASELRTLGLVSP